MNHLNYDEIDWSICSKHSFYALFQNHLSFSVLQKLGFIKFSHPSHESNFYCRGETLGLSLWFKIMILKWLLISVFMSNFHVDPTFTTPYTSNLHMDPRTRSTISKAEAVSGSHRSKYFKRPIMPKVKTISPDMFAFL